VTDALSGQKKSSLELILAVLETIAVIPEAQHAGSEGWLTSRGVRITSYERH